MTTGRVHHVVIMEMMVAMAMTETELQFSVGEKKIRTNAK